MNIKPYQLSIISACLFALVSPTVVYSQETETIPEEAETIPQKPLTIPKEAETILQQSEIGYTPEFVNFYMGQCVGTKGSEAENFCQCTIDKIQEKYPYEEFLSIGLEITGGAEPPEDFNKLIKSCEAGN
ncbi:hypothetical protein BJP36_26400 [Moorena producens JHB]|uniref:Uncharacterized protein n=1 Tax=Moorena producens (strain JHB) TaxID=1454205 RepID=A0A1D9G5L1_MOOP1|nr:hypothetical protein [Moorena producens]AOY82917.1 hypothetical protein BJP36_26400 [Moorena producens JHB]